jgi:hypothetical protein
MVVGDVEVYRGRRGMKLKGISRKGQAIVYLLDVEVPSVLDSGDKEEVETSGRCVTQIWGQLGILQLVSGIHNG